MLSVRRILVVDDEPRLRTGVRQLVLDEWPDADVGEAASASEALEQVRRHEWSLVLMDIQMPDISGLDALVSIKAARPTLPVLIMSMLPEAPYKAHVLGLGASAFIPKEALAERLGPTMGAILAVQGTEWAVALRDVTRRGIDTGKQPRNHGRTPGRSDGTS